MQKKDGSCFHIHSVSLCLFIGEIEFVDVERYQRQMIVNSCYFVVIVVGGLVVCFPSFDLLV